MRVKDYIPEASKRLVVVAPDVGVHELAAKLAERGIDLVVVVKDGVMRGVVTDSDIVTWAAGLEDGVTISGNAASLMSTNVFSCQPERSLADVVKDAASRGLKHFPIVNEKGEPLGVIYVAAALIRLEKENQLSAEWLLAYIRGAGYH